MKKNRAAEKSLSDVLSSLVEKSSGKSKVSFRSLAKIAGLDPRYDFRGAQLQGLDFRDENLRGFDFSGADLTGADFRRAQVSQTYFENATLTGVVGLNLDDDLSTMELLTKRDITKLIKRIVLDGGEIPDDLRFYDIDLRLGNSKISNLSALSTLPNLRGLSLPNTPVESIEAIYGLEKLEYLNIDNTQITDLSPLGKSYQLKRLNMRETRIPNLDGIHNSVELVSIFADATQLEDISHISYLDELKTLVLGSDRLRSLNPLNSLSNIRTLRITSGKPIREYELTPMPKLESLHLDFPFKNVDFVIKSKNIESLSLCSDVCRSLPNINKLSSISYLNLSLPCIENLDILLGGDKLRGFSLSNMPTVTERFLINYRDVESLSLERLDISSLDFLSEFRNLKYLKLSWMPEINIQDIPKIPELLNLTLSGINISNLGFLSRLPNLMSLAASYSGYKLQENDRKIHNANLYFANSGISFYYKSDGLNVS